MHIIGLQHNGKPFYNSQDIARDNKCILNIMSNKLANLKFKACDKHNQFY